MSMSDFERSYFTSSYHNFEPYGVRTKKSLQKRNQIATYRHALPETLSFDVFFPSHIPTAPISTKFYLRRAVEIKLKRGGGGGLQMHHVTLDVFPAVKCRCWEGGNSGTCLPETTSRKLESALLFRVVLAVVCLRVDR